ncbi:MAG: hypothetical protein HY526_06035 [Betaproteobacteria bacterium]|nr:hypothetical protein [Betaproteobacteria bacterium]
MPYSLQEFCEDTKRILKVDPGRGGVKSVMANIGRLIKDDDFIKEYFHDEIEHGVRRLYVDGELGFVVLGYRCEKAHSTPVHDHGNSWALYGQVRDYTEMTEYDRIDDGTDPTIAKLGVKTRYKLNPGRVGMYWGKQLHAAFTPVGCRYLRVTGTDLDRIARVRIDQATSRIMG